MLKLISPTFEDIKTWYQLKEYSKEDITWHVDMEVISEGEYAIITEEKYPENLESWVIILWLFSLNKVGGVMFGFTKRHEQDWRLTRLEEDNKTMFEKFDKIGNSPRAQEKIYDKLDRDFEELRRDKEEDEKSKEKNAKNIRDVKMWILGLIGMILSMFVIALLRTIFGI